ncbi:hypothetical protein AB0L86_27255 [Micromonospora musae]|uniref:hypothetical protein n=1 Tax=Micromonospora musae TaxID=1894970 RepID=UPI003426DBE2
MLAIAVPLGFLGATLVAAPALAGEPAGADLRAGAAVSAADDAAKCAADKAATSTDGSTMTPTVELNPCADIDLSQIIDCRSGTCYRDAGQCSALQGGGEGPRGRVARPERALDRGNVPSGFGDNQAGV